MYKFFGAALVVAACGSIGFMMAAAHRKEVRLMKELITSIHFMRCELEYRCIPLPDLCRKTAHITSDAISAYFTVLSKTLDGQVLPDPKSCCAYALSQQKNLPQSVRNVIQSLSDTLGCFDMNGQIEGLQATIKQAESVLEKLTLDQDVRLRSYQTLAICAGAALAILLV